jgi:hypothetical protein
MPLHKNIAYDIPIVLISSITGDVVIGADISVYRCLDGEIQEAGEGTISEIGNGQYVYQGNGSDFNADYTTGLLFIADGAVPVHVLFQMQYFRKDTAYDIPFLLINVNTSLPLISATPQGIRCFSRTGQENVTGTFEERGNGQYVFHATEEDFGGDEIIGFLITATDAVPLHLIIDLLEPYTATDYPTDSPASILATYMTGVSLMTPPSAGENWPLYISSLPDGDNIEDEIGAIFNTTPIKDGRDMKTGEVIEHYGIQIIIRANTEEEGWSKCNEIVSKLDSIFNIRISKGDNIYLLQSASRVGGVGCLGYEDGTKRRRLSQMEYKVSISKI